MGYQEITDEQYGRWYRREYETEFLRLLRAGLWIEDASRGARERANEIMSGFVARSTALQKEFQLDHWDYKWGE